MIKFRDYFNCDKCKKSCDGYIECVKYLENDYPRKIKISCLGIYCDDKCEFNNPNSNDLTINHLIDLTKYLGDELNKFLIK